MSAIKTVTRGVIAGAAVGAVCYVIAQSSPKQKKQIRKNAEKTMCSVGDIVSTFAGMIR